MESSIKEDHNFLSHYGKSNADISEIISGTFGDFDAILKVSHSSNLRGTVVVPNGRENAVDINVCSNITLFGYFGGGGVTGAQVITAKGGSHDIIIGGVITSAKTNSGIDVDIGNHSDQSRALTRRVKLNLVREDGSPVKVRIGWALPFSVKLGPGCKYMLWSSLTLKSYVLLKLIVRVVLRIPPGVKGPAWL